MATDFKSRAKTHFFAPAPDRGDYPEKYNFYLIRRVEDLKVVFGQQREMLAFDTETTDLNHLEADLVGFSFCSDGLNTYYVPVGHMAGNIDDPTRTMSLLREFLKGKSVLYYNKRYDLRILEQQGIDTNSFKHLDVMLPVWLCDTNFPMPSLKWAEKHFLGWEPMSFEDLTQGAALAAMDPAQVTQYAGTDALGTYLLFERTVMLLPDSKYIIHLDNAATDVIKRIEETPIKLDRQYLERMLPEVDADLDRLRVEIFQLAGTVFNPESNDQVGQILVANGCAPPQLTKGGKVSTSADNLKHIKHPLVQKLLEYRSKSTVRGSYIAKLIDEAQRKDGVIYVNHLTCRVPCLGKETIVYCRDKGFIKISELVPGDFIWTHGGWDEVEEVRQTGRARVYSCELEDGRLIRGSYRHPVMTVRGQKDLGQLRAGDVLDPDGRYSTRDHVDRFTFVPIEFEGSYLAAKCDQDRVARQPKQTNPELMYLWGYLSAAARLDGGSLVVMCDLVTRARIAPMMLNCHKVAVSRMARQQESFKLEFTDAATTAFYQHCKVLCDCVPDLVRQSGPQAVLFYTKGLLEYAESSLNGKIPDWSLEIVSEKGNLLKQLQVCLYSLEFATILEERDGKYKLFFARDSMKRFLDMYPLVNGKVSQQGEPEGTKYYPQVKHVWHGGEKERLWDICMAREPWFLSAGVYTHNTGRYATGADRKNSFFSRVNIQSIPKPKGQDYTFHRENGSPADRNRSLCGWVFEPVDLSSSPPGMEYVEGLSDKDNVRMGIVSYDGYLWISIDFKAQELRIPANFSGEPVFLRAFREGLDLHTEVAKAVFGDGSKEFRRIAKNLNFGLMYLGSAYTMQREIGCSLEKAQEYVRAYERAHKTLYSWKGAVINRAKRTGFVRTYYGRPSRVRSMLASSDSREVYYGYRKSVNSIVQGCLPGHVRILTEQGYLPIEFLYAMDGGHRCKVWTGKRWANFKVVYKGQAHPAYLFTKDGRRLDCDHRHIVRRHTGHRTSKFEDCADLKVSQGICTVSPRSIEFTDRSVGITCFTNGGQYKLSEDQLDDMAYWTGVFLTSAQRRGNTLIVYSDRQGQLEQLEKFLSEVGVSCRLVKREYVSLTSKSFVSYLSGTWMCDFSIFMRRGIPKLMWTLPLRFRQAFFNGVFVTATPWPWEVCGSVMARELQVLYEVTFDSALRIKRQSGETVLTEDNTPRPKHQDQDYNRAYFHDFRVDKDSRLIDTYTLSVEDEDPQFVSEGFVSKNTGADVLKKAMVNVHLNRKDLILKKDLIFHPVVHDEINFLVREEKVEEIIPLLVEDMTINEEGWSVPLTVDFSIGRTWGLIYPFELKGGRLVPSVKTKG